MTEATQSTEVSNVGSVSWSAITDPTADNFPEHEENAKKIIDLVFKEYPTSHKAISSEMDIRFCLHLYIIKKWTLETCVDSIITELKSIKYFSMKDQGQDVPASLEAMDGTDTKENRDRVREFLLEHYSA